MTTPARQDRTHLSDKHFTAVYMVTILLAASAVASLPVWWWRILAFGLVGWIWGAIGERRLGRNHQAGYLAAHAEIRARAANRGGTRA